MKIWPDCRVTETMTPSGVEQLDYVDADAPISLVTETMTPSGVEQHAAIWALARISS